MTNPVPAPGKFDPNLDGAILGAAHMLGGKYNVAIGAQDAGVATEVGTAVFTAPADGEIIAAFLICTEVFVGSTNAGQTWLAKAAAGTTEMTIKGAEFTVAETVAKNVLSSVQGLPQHGTEENRQFELGDIIYAYTEAETSRSAGMYSVIVLWQERAT